MLDPWNQPTNSLKKPKVCVAITQITISLLFLIFDLAGYRSKWNLPSDWSLWQPV